MSISRPCCTLQRSPQNALRSRSTLYTAFILTCLLAAFASTAWGQQVSVRVYGKVADAEGNPIQGVKMRVETVEAGTEHSANIETDKKGRYRTVFIHPSKAYRFTLKKEGYADLVYLDEIGLNRTNFNAPLNNNFVMQKGSSGGSGGADHGSASGSPASKTYNAGVEAFEAEDFELARQLLSQAITEDPALVPAYGALAAACFELEDFQASITHAKKALELEQRKQDAEVLYRAAEMEDDAAARGLALSVLADLDPSPRTARMLYNDGVAAYRNDDCSVAEPRFRRALELHGALKEARVGLARCLLSADQLEEAKVQAEKVLEVDSYNQDATDILYQIRRREPGDDEEEEEDDVEDGSGY